MQATCVTLCFLGTGRESGLDHIAYEINLLWSLLFIPELNKEKGDNLLNNCKYKCFIVKIQGHSAGGSVLTKSLYFHDTS